MSRVRIRGVAAGGDGVGTLEDGRTVFVPRTAPGDTVECAVVGVKPRYAKGVLVAVLEAGPDRTPPECLHYDGDRCGGCQLQHLAYDAQLAAKRRIVGDALRRIGRIEAADPEVVPSPERWRYRTRVSLHAARGRIGYHRVDDPVDVFDLADCRLAKTGLMDLWQAVARARGRLPSAVAALALREDREGGRHVVVESPASPVWDAGPLAREVGDPEVSYWWCPSQGAARVVAGPRTGFPVLAFAQVHPSLGDRIRADAVAALGDVAGGVVWDLYAGSGETSRALVARGGEVWAVEVDRGAVAWGRGRARDWERGDTIRWETGPAEELVVRLPTPAAVVVNPPRTGLDARVAEAIERRASEGPSLRLVYVSCDPATLARDVRRMPHLALRSVRAYDLFPQTAHVETVAVLEAA
jgi:23S rRNA (uracil1939-C5)-methyltransferase